MPPPLTPSLTKMYRCTRLKRSPYWPSSHRRGLDDAVSPLLSVSVSEDPAVTGSDMVTVMFTACPGA